MNSVEVNSRRIVEQLGGLYISHEFTVSANEKQINKRRKQITFSCENHEVNPADHPIITTEDSVISTAIKNGTLVCDACNKIHYANKLVKDQTKLLNITFKGTDINPDIIYHNSDTKYNWECNTCNYLILNKTLRTLKLSDDATRCPQCKSELKKSKLKSHLITTNDFITIDNKMYDFTFECCNTVKREKLSNLIDRKFSCTSLICNKSEPSVYDIFLKTQDLSVSVDPYTRTTKLLLSCNQCNENINKEPRSLQSIRTTFLKSKKDFVCSCRN